MYTTGPAAGQQYAKLWKWEVHISGEDVPNEYVNYTAVPDSERKSWAANFQVPAICKGNIVKCDGLHKQGKLSDKSIRFLRSGTLGKPGFLAAGRK